jgi:hypothetical protein
MELDTKTRLRRLGESLCKLSYRDIEKELSGLDLDGNSLVELLNHRSRKVGDTAFSLLYRKEEGPRLVIDAILSDRFTHRVAKIRATNFLLWRGRKCPEAMKAYLHHLDDRSGEVVSGALFGIVFYQDTGKLEMLRRRRDALAKGNGTRAAFEEAIRALEEENPFLFSPGFHDAADVWGLDKKRFADRIGRR